MQTYISILRGINVSGHRLIKMDALKTLCANLNFKDVHTYIQSGNIIYNYEMIENAVLNSLISESIEKTFGFKVPVITLNATELQHTIENNPYSGDETKDPSFFHVTFLSDMPDPEKIKLLEQVNLKNDTFTIIESTIYIYCPDGYGQTNLTNNYIESKLNLTATTRNWKTVNELLNIAREIES